MAETAETQQQSLSDRLGATITPVANGYIVKAGVGPMSRNVFKTWEEVVAHLSGHFKQVQTEFEKARRTR